MGDESRVFRPSMVSWHTVFILCIILISAFALYFWPDFIFAGVIVLILISSGLFVLVNGIVLRFFYTKLKENSIVIKPVGRKPITIRFSDITSIKITRSIYAWGGKIIAIKVKPSFLKKHPHQPQTEKWDFFIPLLRKSDMALIINKTKKGISSTTKPVRNAKYPKKEVTTLRMLNLGLFLAILLTVVISFMLKLPQLIVLIPAVAGIFLIIIGIISKRLRIAIGLGFFRLSDISKERAVLRKGYVEILSILYIISGIILIAVSIIITIFSFLLSTR